MGTVQYVNRVIYLIGLDVSVLVHSLWITGPSCVSKKPAHHWKSLIKDYQQILIWYFNRCPGVNGNAIRLSNFKRRPNNFPYQTCHGILTDVHYFESLVWTFFSLQLGFSSCITSPAEDDFFPNSHLQGVCEETCQRGKVQREGRVSQSLESFGSSRQGKSSNQWRKVSETLQDTQTIGESPLLAAVVLPGILAWSVPKKM